MTNKDLKMNFKIHTPLLHSLISQVERAAAKLTTIEILRGIYLEISSKKLTLRAMNAEYGIEISIDQEPILVGKKTINNFELEGDGGSMVIVQKNFKSIISKLPTKIAEFKVDGQYVTLHGGKTTFNIVTLDSDEFPQFPEVKKASVMEFRPEELTRAYEDVVRAVSSSNGRPVLTGVNHSVVGDNIFFIGTDSHLLLRRMIPLEEGKGKEYLKEIDVYDKNGKKTGEKETVGHSITVPESSIQEVIRQMRSVDTVKLSYNDNMAIYQLDNITMFTRLLEGSFPDTSRLIPKAFTTEIRFYKKDLFDLVDRSLLVFESAVTTAQIRTIPEKGQFRLSTSEAQSGSSFEEDLSTVQAAGESMHIALGLKMLLELLKVHSDDTLIKIQMLGALKPIVISRADQEYDYDTSLLLPTRLTKEQYDKKVLIKDFKAPIQMNLPEEVEPEQQEPVAQEPVASPTPAQEPVAQEPPVAEKEPVIESDVVTPPVQEAVPTSEKEVLAQPVREEAGTSTQSAVSAFAMMANAMNKSANESAVATAEPAADSTEPVVDANNPFAYLMKEQPNQPQGMNNTFVNQSIQQAGE